ncbi:MAG: TonB-dependent receptor [Bacteroidales bacterium]|nr:TonB-dependent receptor [Bacteroidales bacterium]
MRKIFFIICFPYIFIVGYGQIVGRVWGVRGNDTFYLPYSNIVLINSKVVKVTDDKGFFAIEKYQLPDTLVVSYVGFVSDTMVIDVNQESKNINVYLNENLILKEILITSRRTVEMSYLSPQWKQTLHQNELQRAPCCNLSECFQTTGSVNVTYADAVSGAKQIQFLGLSGKYVQMLMDNVPYMRGAGNSYTLQFIPASWISAIDVSRGAADLTHGSESITGQININPKKPGDAENLYVDLFVGGEGKTEINLSKTLGSSKKGMVMFAHAYRRWMSMDHNRDGFMDAPLEDRFSFQAYGQLFASKKWEFRSGFRAIYDDRSGGQLTNSSYAHIDDFHGAWKTHVNYKVFELYTKGGYVASSKSAWGFIQSTTFIDASMKFGLKEYDCRQNNYYAAILYRYEIVPDKHEFDAGFNMYLDYYAQSFSDSNWVVFPVTTGIFYQHTYFLGKKLTLQAGSRIDYHSFDKRSRLIPRLHLRYNISDKTILRITSGLGVHYPMIFTETPFLFTSNRKIRWENPISYEKAVNNGIALMKYFTLFGCDFTFSLDYFYTYFFSQMLFDIEHDTSFIYVYSSTNKSYAHSMLTELSVSPTKHFEARTAFQLNRRYYPNLNGIMQMQPLLNFHRALLTLSFFTNQRKWILDLTLLWYGKTRLPDRSFYIVDQLPDFSPSFLTGYVQVTKNWKRWKVYGGIENLTNYKQKNPILGYQRPYSNQFESGIIWAPLEGRMYYIGIRYVIL